jgi:hypothetical protein
MQSKIERMSSIIEKREKVILKKWQDQVHLQNSTEKVLHEQKLRTENIRQSLEAKQANKLQRGLDLYQTQQKKIQQLNDEK